MISVGLKIWIGRKSPLSISKGCPLLQLLTNRFFSSKHFSPSTGINQTLDIYWTAATTLRTNCTWWCPSDRCNKPTQFQRAASSFSCRLKTRCQKEVVRRSHKFKKTCTFWWIMCPHTVPIIIECLMTTQKKCIFYEYVFIKKALTGCGMRYPQVEKKHVFW